MCRIAIRNDKSKRSSLEEITERLYPSVPPRVANFRNISRNAVIRSMARYRVAFGKESLSIRSAEILYPILLYIFRSWVFLVFVGKSNGKSGGGGPLGDCTFTFIKRVVPTLLDI